MAVAPEMLANQNTKCRNIKKTLIFMKYDIRVSNFEGISF